MAKQDQRVQKNTSKSINGEHVNSFGDLLDTVVGSLTGSDELSQQNNTDKNKSANNLEPPKYT